MAAQHQPLHRYFSALRSMISDQWRPLVLAQTSFIVLFISIPNFLFSGRPHLNDDETLFAYSGWLWAETAKVPYLHLWDVKPPAIHETAALLSLLAGGNPWGIALLSAVTMCLLIIGSVILIGRLAYYHTSNPVAAYVAASIPLAFRTYYTAAATGLRAKHFSIFFGLLGVYLYLVKNRWSFGGGSAALAAGYWQFGVIFPLLAVVTAYTSGRNELRAVVGGGIGATLLVIAPVYLSSPAAFSSMLVEVIGTSLWVIEPLQIVLRFKKFVRFTGGTLPLLGLGFVGAVLAVLNRETRWITVGAGWVLLQVLRLDFDGPDDLVLLVVFAALGIGILIELLNEEFVLLHLTLGMVVISFIMSSLAVPTPLDTSPPPGSLDSLFWNQKITEQCHVRMSRTERRFVAGVGDNIRREVCRYRIWQLITT